MGWHRNGRKLAQKSPNNLHFPATESMSILNLTDVPEYIPTLAEWHHHEWAHLNPGRTLEKRIESMQGYLGEDLVPSTFIYKHDGQLAGSAAIVVCDMDTRKDLTPWLASVFVAPMFRRQGIGSKLVRHLMLQARQRGIASLYLFTPDQVRFYQKLGWSVLTTDTYHGCPVTVMQACLTGISD